MSDQFDCKFSGKLNNYINEGSDVCLQEGKEIMSSDLAFYNDGKALKALHPDWKNCL